MKIERLLGIIFYLLRHQHVSAQQLAQKFEVSKRTIIRDMETLSLSGIPVFSTSGIKGGYELLDTFELNQTLTNAQDFKNVWEALKTLQTVLEDENLEHTMNKIQVKMPHPSISEDVLVDFGIVRENEFLSVLTKQITAAIAQKKVILFHYKNSEKEREVEPIALNYRWYSWYLIAHDMQCQQTRIFKLSRISELRVTKKQLQKEIQDKAQFVEECWKNDARPKTKLTLFCEKEIKSEIMEYFRPSILSVDERGNFICSFDVVESERLWFGLLLSFGDSVKIIAPEKIKNKMITQVKKIIEQMEK